MNLPRRIEIAVTKRSAGAGAVLPDYKRRVNVGPVGVTVFVWL